MPFQQRVMKGLRCLFILLFLCVVRTASSLPPVTFSKQVLPLLRRECWACHSGVNSSSGYSLENRNALLKGGRHGVAVLVGKGEQSSFIKYLTGEIKPKMPPNRAIDKETIALLKRWIDEGAKVDSYAFQPEKIVANSTQPLKQLHVRLPAPVTALAYSPDGALLAVGGYRCVRFLEPATAKLLRVVPATSDQVQAMTWSEDSKSLLVAGGIPAMSGEAALLDVATGKVIQKFEGHTEVVYTTTWKPKSDEIATGSLDKTVRIWSVRSGQCLRTIKDHADAVFGVAYSPDGKMFASGSADRSVKVYALPDYKQLGVLNAHQDGVTRIAFHPNSKLLASASADKTIRVWSLAKFPVENPERVQYEDATFNACAFSPDGKMFIAGVINNHVRVWNGEISQQIRAFTEPEDWVYSVGCAADNDIIAAGTQDGKVYFWSGKSGKLLRSATVSPNGVTVQEGKP